MEWIKDASESSGWRRVTYEQGKKVEGEGSEGVNVVAGGGDTWDDGEDGMGGMEGAKGGE